jgi:hypothetical protein
LKKGQTFSIFEKMTGGKKTGSAPGRWFLRRDGFLGGL